MLHERNIGFMLPLLCGKSHTTRPLQRGWHSKLPRSSKEGEPRAPP
jgi:hypothetical protein